MVSRAARKSTLMTLAMRSFTSSMLIRSSGRSSSGTSSCGRLNWGMLTLKSGMYPHCCNGESRSEVWPPTSSVFAANQAQALPVPIPSYNPLTMPQALFHPTHLARLPRPLSHPGSDATAGLVDGFAHERFGFVQHFSRLFDHAALIQHVPVTPCQIDSVLGQGKPGRRFEAQTGPEPVPEGARGTEGPGRQSVRQWRRTGRLRRALP